MLGYRERELDIFCFSRFPTAELRTLSLWLCSAQQLGQQLRGTVVVAQCRAYTVVLAAVHGSLGLPGWRLFRGFTLLSPFSHSSPSLIGLLASVDVKQQYSLILTGWSGPVSSHSSWSLIFVSPTPKGIKPHIITHSTA